MIDAQLARTDGRLRNWGRWAWSSGGGRGRCASAEGQYVPPKLAEGEEAVHRTTMALDVIDAELVERIVCAISVQCVKRFLIDCYVRRYDRLKLCRRIRIDQDLLDSFHIRALTVVANDLASQEVRLVRRGKPLWAGVARITTGRV